MPSITLNIQHPTTEEEIEVEVEFTVTPAEEDVGIMSWGIEDEFILKPNEDLNKLIPESQWEKIREKIYSSYDPYDSYDDSDL